MAIPIMLKRFLNWRGFKIGISSSLMTTVSSLALAFVKTIVELYLGEQKTFKSTKNLVMLYVKIICMFVFFSFVVGSAEIRYYGHTSIRPQHMRQERGIRFLIVV